jgi:hypothetical protein
MRISVIWESQRSLVTSPHKRSGDACVAIYFGLSTAWSALPGCLPAHRLSFHFCVSRFWVSWQIRRLRVVFRCFSCSSPNDFQIPSLVLPSFQWSYKSNLSPPLLLAQGLSGFLLALAVSAVPCPKFPGFCVFNNPYSPQVFSLSSNKIFP